MFQVIRLRKFGLIAPIRQEKQFGSFPVTPTSPAIAFSGGGFSFFTALIVDVFRNHF